ncbi:MAG: hypothetical protein IJ008_05620 [Clostridia bacterium]|nr:hypothetical protein [Clostridia bacterium]
MKKNYTKQEILEIMDPLMPKALELVMEKQRVSVALIQKEFTINYPRAARIVDQMEEFGFIESETIKTRKILIKNEQYKDLFEEQND